MLPLFELQRWQAGIKLFRLLEPDLKRGIMWSKEVAGRPQYAHL